MAYKKKTWVNVPDPSSLPSIPEGQDALARFDAENMNRIEEGVEEAHAGLANIEVSLEHGGGKVGVDASSTNGGFSGGHNALSKAGGSIGYNTETEHGGAVGNNAKSNHGGSVGKDTITSDGFAGGYNAKAIDANGDGINAIQLGTGTNTTPKTLQVYDKQLMKADGTIPSERIPLVKNLSTGISIPSNADLNSYTNAGNYICILTETAKTLSNCPVDTAFNMTNSLANGSVSYVHQDLTKIITGEKYYRSYNGVTKEWTEWKVIYSSGNKPKPADIGAARIQIGSYVGTGFGKEVSLTFNFEPQLIVISSAGNIDQAYMVRGCSGTYIPYYDRGVYNIIWSGKTVRWTDDIQDKNLNAIGATYNYVAIG